MCARLDAAENEPSEVSQIGGSAMAMAGGIGLRRRYYQLGHSDAHVFLLTEFSTFELS